MGKKRSKGVVIFVSLAMSLIMLSIVPAFFQEQHVILLVVQLSIAITVLAFIYNLTNWARIVAPAFCILQAIVITLIVVLAIILLPTNSERIISSIKSANLSVYDYALAVLNTVYAYSFIYFFTRPKVKEQFK
ncbi:hypothetical protein ACFL42_00785 [Candidatus Omnitrophota bacterium]